MNLSPVRQSQLSTVVAVIVVLGAAGAFMVLTVAVPVRLFVVLFGVLGLIIAAFISGNPRLFILWVLMLALPMALSKHFGEIYFKGGGEQSFRIELYDPFVIMLGILQIRDALIGRVGGLRIPKITWYWAAIMMLGVLYVIEGPWRTYAAQELVRMVKVILLFLVLVNEFKTPQRMLSCAVPLALGVLLQAGVGIGQYLKGNLLGLEVLGETTPKTIQNLAFTSVEGQRAFRPSGLLLHANIFGIYIATMLPLLIAAFLVHRKFLVRALLIGIITIGMVGMILSQSRSAWVSFALAFGLLLVLMLAHRGLSKRALFTTAVSGAALFVVVLGFSGQILKRLFQSKADATVGREVFLQDFYRLISDHWLFGTGLNTYVAEVVPYLSFSQTIYHGWVPPVHNIYFLWWGELGIFGLALNLLLWGTVVWIGIKNLQVRNETFYAINAACLAAMLAFAFDGFLSFSLRVNQPQRVFFLLSAMIFAIHYWRLRQITVDNDTSDTQEVVQDTVGPPIPRRRNKTADIDPQTS